MEPARKRGPIPRISRESVLQVARDMPPSQLTMTAIAARVGVTTGALYRYFPDRAAVLEGLAREAQALIQPPDQALPWRDWLMEQIQQERALWAAHPELVDAAAMTVVAGPASVVLTVGMDVLQRAGFSPSDALKGLMATSALAFALNKMAETRTRVLDTRDHESAGEAHLRDLGLTIDVDGLAADLIAITLDGLAQRLPKPR